MDTLIRMNPAKEDQVITARFLERVQREVDPVVDCRQVIQPRCAIGVADGNKISVTILLINWHDFGRREYVDGSEDRCLDQPAVGQRHEVVVTMDEVKLSSTLERFGDVKVFGYFGIDGGILFMSFVNHGVQVSAGHRIPTGEQRHIPTTGDESSVMLLATVSQAP